MRSRLKSFTVSEEVMLQRREFHDEEVAILNALFTYVVVFGLGIFDLDTFPISMLHHCKAHSLLNTEKIENLLGRRGNVFAAKRSVCPLEK